MVYFAPSEQDLILREELDALAADHGFALHYVIGRGRDLRELVPDLTERDVYVCGPPEMVDATRAGLHALGVRRIVTERFAL